MKLHITNTDTQKTTVLDERQLNDLVRALRKDQGLQLRGEATLYIWHGKDAPSPMLEFREFRGRKGRWEI